MDINQQGITLHPEVLDRLFAYQSKTRSLFSDVLGLHEINHIAFAYISKQKTLLSLSSTPSIEYNLFSGPLWQFDKTYHPNWFNECGHGLWQSLYSPERYDELYYLKQIKPRYPLAISKAAKFHDEYLVYSFASHKDTEYTRDILENQRDEIYQLGQYCSTHLLPLLLEDNETLSASNIIGVL